MIKKIVGLLLVFSILLSLIFAVGFVYSVNISASEEDSNDIPDPDYEIQQEDISKDSSSEILILGDSIGFGIGDEENLGIGDRYIDLIDDAEEKPIEITNISIPGLESNDLVELIKSGTYQSNIEFAELIVISIGGNDLNRLEYEDELTMNITFKEALKNYTENLNFIIKEIREVNPKAQLAFIGLYNPYAREEPLKTKFLLEWNYETRLIIDSDSKFSYIPTYEVFEYHLEEYLSPDNFHPSASGYQVIAETLFRILN